MLELEKTRMEVDKKKHERMIPQKRQDKLEESGSKIGDMAGTVQLALNDKKMTAASFKEVFANKKDVVEAVQTAIEKLGKYIEDSDSD